MLWRRSQVKTRIWVAWWGMLDEVFFWRVFFREIRWESMSSLNFFVPFLSFDCVCYENYIKRLICFPKIDLSLAIATFVYMWMVFIRHMMINGYDVFISYEIDYSALFAYKAKQSEIFLRHEYILPRVFTKYLYPQKL